MVAGGGWGFACFQNLYLHFQSIIRMSDSEYMFSARRSMAADIRSDDEGSPVRHSGLNESASLLEPDEGILTTTMLKGIKRKLDELATNVKKLKEQVLYNYKCKTNQSTYGKIVR